MKHMRFRKHYRIPWREKDILIFGLSLSSAFVVSVITDLNAAASIGTLFCGLLLFWIERSRYVERETALFGRQERLANAERIYRAHQLDSLMASTPREFEYTVAALLASAGATNVQVSGGSGDLAADIVCRDKDGHVLIVQCKRYALNRKVSSPDMQLFIGMIYAHHYADRGAYATTSTFTKGAIDLARTHSIELYDGHRLTSLARELQN